MNKYVCYNCLQEFANNSSLQNHINNIKKCNKVILNNDGTIQNPHELQCQDCFKLLKTKWSFKNHKQSCKKRNNTNISNSIINGDVNGNNNINNINNVINNFNITNFINTKAPFYHITPTETYKPIDDNFITMKSFVPLFGKMMVSINETNYYKLVIDTITAIVVDEYAKNQDVFSRTSWSTESINDSSKTELHLFKKHNNNGKWSIDENGLDFFKGVVQSLIKQLNNTINDYHEIVDILDKFDFIRLKKYLIKHRDLLEQKIVMCNCSDSLTDFINDYNDQQDLILSDKKEAYERYISIYSLSVKEAQEQIEKDYSKIIYERFSKKERYGYIQRAIKKTLDGFRLIRKALLIDRIDILFFNKIKEKLQYDIKNNINIKDYLNNVEKKDIGDKITIN